MTADQISDQRFLQVVADHRGPCHIWHIRAALKDYPPAVVEAKACQMLGRGYAEGSALDQLPGRWKLTPTGRARLLEAAA